MARPQKNNVDYFPHDVHMCKTLRLLTRKFGNDGYAFFFRLRELLGMTSNHNYSVENEIDWLDFNDQVGLEEEKAKVVIEFAVKIGELDQEAMARRAGNPEFAELIKNDVESHDFYVLQEMRPPS